MTVATRAPKLAARDDPTTLHVLTLLQGLVVGLVTHTSPALLAAGSCAVLQHFVPKVTYLTAYRLSLTVLAQLICPAALHLHAPQLQLWL